jgi:DNA-binding NarL/FixJ family response regulator
MLDWYGPSGARLGGNLLAVGAIRQRPLGLRNTERRTGDRGSRRANRRLRTSIESHRCGGEGGRDARQSRSVPTPIDVGKLQELTTRQWEILTLLVQGKRVPTIARELYISPSTVRNHLSAMFKKFGVHSQPELLEALRM